MILPTNSHCIPVRHHRLVFIMEQTVFSVRYEQLVSVKGKKEVKFSMSTEV